MLPSSWLDFDRFKEWACQSLKSLSIIMRIIPTPTGDSNLLVWNDQQQIWMTYLNLLTHVTHDADVRRGGHGCILWFGGLIDIKDCKEDGQDIFVRMPSSELESLKLSSERIALTKIENEDLELPLFDFQRIADATNNFFGEGGFGLVYKIHSFLT
ncbi:hypothetical protein POM88_053001 [Heracleum sosnowskyi]|uniref:Uncharacterized protein n=1 Tax=Heracleum sosnowskyi TaxID=360622 RepID=A0AAD8GRC0_9APIA|nr:hypothetical protein POM88_052991 [Heracleum sosnowskyi]KAK1353163.1 hypothetical protein POM88_053001 [Heracleum sosnowskyi]